MGVVSGIMVGTARAVYANCYVSDSAIIVRLSLLRGSLLVILLIWQALELSR